MTSYAAAGVDIEAGDRAVELMKASVKRTARPEVLGGLGGFAGLFALDLAKYPQPVLASSTDGVGTKIAIAQALDRHDTIGIDLVAMVVDDLVVVGAEPLFLSDYIATGKVVPERIAAIVSGIAEGCVQAGCALVGGETAEHPGVMRARRVRRVRAPASAWSTPMPCSAPERVRAGDVLIALGSSGLHSNGYSLVRHVLLERAGLALDATPGRSSAAAPWATSCSSRPASTPRTAWPWPPRPARTPSPTSPAAGWPATWRGCCRTGSTRSSTAAPGRRRPSSR